MKKTLFLFLLMLHLYFYGLSTSILLSDSLVYSKPINKYVSFYIEKDKHFSVNDIIHLDSIFLPSKNEALNFSYFDDHVWLKLTLNSAKKESLYLEYGPYWADSIQLFCVNKDSIYYQSQLTGTQFQSNDSFKYFDENLAHYIIPFETKEGKTDVYIKLHSKYVAKRISLKLWKKNTFDSRKIPLIQQFSFRYIVFGITLFACLFSIALSVIIQQKVFALYALFLFVHILNLFSVKGWLYPFFEIFRQYGYDYKGPINALLIMSSTIYIFYLIPKKYSNSLVRYSLLGIFILCAVLFPIPFFVKDSPTLFRFLVVVFKPIFFMAVPLTLVHFYISAKKGYKISWLLLISHSLIAINAVFHLLQVFGLMGIFHDNYTWEIALFFELGLYSIAMIYFYKMDILEKKRIEEELIKNRQEYIVNLLYTQEQERIRIARDLHDSIGMKLSVVGMMLSNNDTDIKIKSLLDEAINETRIISHNLIPEEVNLGLEISLKTLVDTINNLNEIKIDFKFDNKIINNKQADIHIYRVIQEVLNNMIKHAGASVIVLEFSQKFDIIEISISDNGKGFDTNAIYTSSGIGWQNIYARVTMLKGKIDIRSSSSGTKILIRLPITRI